MVNTNIRDNNNPQENKMDKNHDLNLGYREIDVQHDWGASTSQYANLMEVLIYIKNQKKNHDDDIISDIDERIDIVHLNPK